MSETEPSRRRSGCLAGFIKELLEYQPGTIDPTDEPARKKLDDLMGRFLEFRKGRESLSRHTLGCLACDNAAVLIATPAHYEIEIQLGDCAPS